MLSIAALLRLHAELLLPVAALLLPVAAAVAGLVDVADQVFAQADELLPHSSAVEVNHHYLDPDTGTHRKLCTVHALGGSKDDSDNFVAAVDACGHGGIIRLPDANYTIGQPLDITLSHAVLDVHGWMTWTTDIEYWVANHIPFEFQNQSLAWVVRGNDYVINGNDKGGIDGNGQVWYTWAREEGNKYGRPMSLAIVDSKNVLVKNWSIIQPQFWASVVISSENVVFRDFYVNATSYDPESWSDPKSWTQNTDGSDTYRSRNVTYENMVYQGGDDCIALKPNSSEITLRNVTCYGGTGIAFGSIAQYEGITDYIEDVYMEDLFLTGSSQSLMYQGVYFKSWIGFPIGHPPNGGGGGTGWCRNVTVKNLWIEDVKYPIAVQTGLTYLDSERGQHRDSDLFEWSDIHFYNVTGTARGNRIVWLDCAKATPCFNWSFEHLDIKPGKDDHPEVEYVCNNIVLGGGDGLSQCHPSNSTWETEPGGSL